jgi:putative ABC transport system ATP-binding protein
VLRVEGLSKAFRGAPVLSSVSFTLQPGQSMALLGRSGSGKSTLLKILSGLERADAGIIELDGVRLDTLSEDQRTRHRRRNIGQVFQFFELIDTLSVRENLALPLKLNRLPIDEALIERELEQIGLAGMADRFPDTLSGGEQQRLAVLRALIHQPALVLADEPTGNLDEDNARAVMALLRERCQAQSAMLVLVTHAPDTADFVDQRHWLKHGRL